MRSPLHLSPSRHATYANGAVSGSVYGSSRSKPALSGEWPGRVLSGLSRLGRRTRFTGGGLRLLLLAMLAAHVFSLIAYYGLNLARNEVPVGLAAEQAAFGGVGNAAGRGPGPYADGGLHTKLAALAGHPPDAVASKQTRRIPRIIHQTFRTAWKRNMPRDIKRLMASWKLHNPGYEIRLYDDAACAQFVAANFPQYLAAYRALPKSVERSDFFRYMVVLRHGGAYADIDTECRAPLDSLVGPSDTLIVGWENEFESPEHTRRRSYIRQRQLLQWAFLAAPGHPVLVALCEHVAASALRRFSAETNRNTLEKTGPGAFTDAVLRYVAAGQRARRAAEADAEGGGRPDEPTPADNEGPGIAPIGDLSWRVRILPRVAFATNPGGHDGIPAEAPGIRLLHHFKGSWKDDAAQVIPAWLRVDKLVHWKSLGRHLLAMFPALPATPAALQALWASLPPLPLPRSWATALDLFAPQALPCLPARLKAAVEARKVARRCVGPGCPEATEDVSGVGLADFPVSVDHEPPFDLLVEPAGVDRVSRLWPGEDTSAELTSWGMSHPGQLPWRRPSVPQVVLAALRHRNVSGLVALDVGAGLGLVALAAAASGLTVHAVEPNPRRAALLRRSAALTGSSFGPVHVHQLAAGAEPAAVCWQDVARSRPQSPPQRRRRLAEKAARERRAKGSPRADANVDEEGGEAGRRRGGGEGSTGEQSGVPEKDHRSGAGVGRGTDAEVSDADGGDAELECSATDRVAVQPLDALWAQIAKENSATSGGPGGLGARGPGLALLRLSVGGAAGWVLEGARQLLKRRPPALLLLELQPRLLSRSGYAAPSQLFRQLVAAGYSHGFHTGAGCDALADRQVPRCKGRHCGALLRSDLPAHLSAEMTGTGESGDELRRVYAARREAAQEAWVRRKTACGPRGGEPARRRRRRRQASRRLLADEDEGLQSPDDGVEGESEEGDEGDSSSDDPLGEGSDGGDSGPDSSWRRRLLRVFGVDDGDEVPNPSGLYAQALRAPWDARWCALNLQSVGAMLDACHTWLPESVLLVRQADTKPGRGSKPRVSPAWLASMVDASLQATPPLDAQAEGGGAGA